MPGGTRLVAAVAAFATARDAEAAVWAAIRTLQEKAALHRNLAERSTPSHHSRLYHEERADEADVSAEVLRDLLRRPFASPGHDMPADGADAS